STGRRDQAESFVEEVLAGVRSDQSRGNAEYAFPVLAMTCVELGRAEQFLEATKDITVVTPWLVTSRAYAAGDLEQAVELSRPLCRADSSWMQLRAAERLVDAGKR